ncbi:MAG: ribosome maturation factor RimM [Chitinophagales bacterium]|nr:ribosome maturation factor RimM [Chitinophagales bacterium]
MEQYIKIGRINKSFGLKGHLRFFIEPVFITRIKKLDCIFLLSQSKHFPYFIDEVDLTETGHGMLHFEEVKDKTIADFLVGKEIYFDKSLFKKEKKFATLADFIGFKLIDENKKVLGELSDVIDFATHDVGQFFVNGKEVLFPWNEEVILKIDKKKKEINVQLPEGLLDIYLI